MALTGTQLALLTARSGAARSGAFRSGFVPVDVRGDTPGSQGPFYMWAEVALPSTTWTVTTS